MHLLLPVLSMHRSGMSQKSCKSPGACAKLRPGVSKYCSCQHLDDVLFGSERIHSAVQRQRQLWQAAFGAAAGGQNVHAHSRMVLQARHQLQYMRHSRHV